MKRSVAMLSGLRDAWRRLPAAIRRPVARSGLPYAVNFVISYHEKHRIENFAGNLEQMKAAYRDANGIRRAELTRQLDAIADCLVMPNGVRKTSYADRLGRTVSTILSANRFSLPRSEIRVLDVPASTGVASLQSYALLSERYRIASYVLGDLYHGVLYDKRRRCVFDEQGNLLQVGSKSRYFSIYREHTSGDRYTFLSACLLLPHSVASWCLRKRYRFQNGNGCTRQLVVHPDVERLVAEGTFRIQVMDVFRPIPGGERYDLILSFNLLQRNYFPPATIAAGVNNLAAALNEAGVLVMGNTESFEVLQKRSGVLTSLMRQGSF